MERTQHGDNIADQIQEEDAYGHFDIMNECDIWNILDQFQSHLIEHGGQTLLVGKLSNWMRELEKDFPDSNFIY